MLIILGLVFSFSFSYAQFEKDKSLNKRHKNITVGINGANLTQGAHFDMRFRKNKMNGFGFKVGVGGFSLRRFLSVRVAEEGIVTAPIQLNYVLGKKRHGLELGFGALPVYAKGGNTEVAIGNQNLAIDNIDLIGGLATIGYKFQPKNTGLSFAINSNHVITESAGTKSYLGIQIGIGFK